MIVVTPGRRSVTCQGNLTQVTDLRLRKLADAFGPDAVRRAWLGGAVAINTIEQRCRAEELACDFQRVPGSVNLDQGCGSQSNRRQASPRCRSLKELMAVGDQGPDAEACKQDGDQKLWDDVPPKLL